MRSCKLHCRGSGFSTGKQMISLTKTLRYGFACSRKWHRLSSRLSWIRQVLYSLSIGGCLAQPGIRNDCEPACLESSPWVWKVGESQPPKSNIAVEKDMQGKPVLQHSAISQLQSLANVFLNSRTSLSSFYLSLPVASSIFNQFLKGYVSVKWQ